MEALLGLGGLLVAILGIMVFFIYVLGPVMVLAMLRFPDTPAVVQCDPQRDALPEDARQFFAETYVELSSLGFQLIGTFALPDVLPNVRSLLAMYEHADGHMAMATVIVAEGIGTSKLKYSEFSTRYTNGLVVMTSNSTQLSSFRPLSNEFPCQLPALTDLSRLFMIHRGRCEQHRAGAQPERTLRTKFNGRAAEFIGLHILRRSFEEQVKVGYLRRTSQGFGASVKGACLMAWGEAFPIKQIRMAGVRRRANEVLAEHAWPAKA